MVNRVREFENTLRADGEVDLPVADEIGIGDEIREIINSVPGSFLKQLDEVSSGPERIGPDRSVKLG